MARFILQSEVRDALKQLGIQEGKLVRYNEETAQLVVVLYTWVGNRGKLKDGWQKAVKETAEALKGAGIAARESTKNAVIIDGWL